MRKFVTIFSLFVGLIVLSGALQAQDVRRLTVGRLVFAMDNNGANWMSSELSGGQNGPSIRYDWEPWPNLGNDIGYHGVDINAGGEHRGHGKALYGNGSYWFASTNWTAPTASNWGSATEDVYTPGITYPVFINDNGPVTLSAQINTPFWFETRYTRRVAMPEVIVNDIVQDPVAFNPDGNSYTVDGTIKIDGIVHARWADPMGLTIDEKRYGFTHPLYDAIIISELTIINSGDCNTIGDFAGQLEKPDQVLTDFWFGVKHLLADAYDWTDFGSFERYNGEIDWLLDYDTATRYFWTWDGDAKDIPGDDQFDPRGGPIGTGTADNPTGEFTAPEVTGYAFLYISDGPEDGTAADDPAQPATFRFIPYKGLWSPVFSPADRTPAWEWMTGLDGEPMYQTGHSADPYEEVPENQPHYDPVLGIGPYDLAFNDSIKVVIAFAVGSIPEIRAIELGDKVRKNAITLATAKQEIYEGGQDSLFALYARAQDLYDTYISKGIAVPSVPDPPARLEITPGPEQVSLDWDAVTGADGYRVYRATGGIDNGRVYEMIKETTGTSYVDPGRTRGASYYYYVTAFEGGLESSPFFTRTHKDAVPTRAPLTEDDWDQKVRVVPNPINVKGNTYIEGATGITGFNFDGGYREQNTLLFVNLPAECTIYIYNSVGDLIKTLEHTTGTGDERWNPIITDDNLIPASGVYFYIIQVTEGDLTPKIGKGKFVVVR